MPSRVVRQEWGAWQLREWTVEKDRGGVSGRRLACSARPTYDEDGSDSHRSEVPGEQCLPPRLDIRNPPLQCKDGGQPAQGEDTCGEQDEAPHGEGEHLVLPCAEGHGGAEVDEDCAIGEQIDGRGEVGLFDGLGEPASGVGSLSAQCSTKRRRRRSAPVVPGESSSAGESSEQVVGSGEGGEAGHE